MVPLKASSLLPPLGSYFSPSFKDCGGNWQNTVPFVPVMDSKDVTGT